MADVEYPQPIGDCLPYLMICWHDGSIRWGSSRHQDCYDWRCLSWHTNVGVGCYDTACLNAAIQYGGIGVQIDLLAAQLSGSTEKVTGELDSVEKNLKGYILYARDGVLNSINAQSNYINLLNIGLNNAINNSIRSQTSNLENSIKNANEQTTASVTYTIEQAEGSILDGIGNMGLNITRDILGVGGVLEGALGFIGDGINAVVSTLESFIGTVTSTIELSVSRTLNALKEIFQVSLLTIANAFTDFSDFMKSAPGIALETFKVEWATSTGNFDALFDELYAGEFETWDEFIAKFDQLLKGDGLFYGILYSLSTVTSIMKLAQIYTQPLMQNLEILATEKGRPTQLNYPELFAAHYRRSINMGQLVEQLGLLGYNPDRIEQLKVVSKPLLALAEIKGLYLRGVIDEASHADMLRAFGFVDEQINQMIELYYYIPPVPDIIRMAVREVFTPDIAEQYGLFEDVPQEYLEVAATQGVSEKWARYYWGAHWQLPSTIAGFEMFHRRIIDQKELQTLLRAQDYMPHWRPKLVQLSFRVLTRVDVRRMHKIGVIDDIGVYNAYLDLGYSPENAQLMTQFTIKYNAPPDLENASDVRQLSLTVITKAYHTGVLTENAAISRLERLGYSLADAQLILELSGLQTLSDIAEKRTSRMQERLVQIILDGYETRSLSRNEALEELLKYDYTREEARQLLDLETEEHKLKFRRMFLDDVKTMYIQGNLDQLGFRAILSENDFTPNEIDFLLGELALIKQLRNRQPTKAELAKAHKIGYLTIGEYVEKLKGLGYPNDVINMYLEFSKPEEEEEEE